MPAAAGTKRPSNNGATSSPTNRRPDSTAAPPTTTPTPAPAPKVSATPPATPTPPAAAAAAAPQPRATRPSPSSARPTQPKVIGGVTYNLETLSSQAAVADVEAHPVEGTEGPRLEFYMTGKKVLIEMENSLDLSDFPKANVISRKQVVVTALKSGSFTIENFARNTTSLNGTTATLPFELSFADVVVVFKPPAKPRVPAWWVAMWAEKREAKEKENPKNPK
ncbi:uncharacterized protein ACA1_307470 [Acanthamoeba castellanii str. Neff]|uniref:FHA domain-containing protein n=1 Tax=Acanthamoeba castellanii (strain ATCC 30010 / Neff) TaxID=1257118 RepID=L8H4X7_ACACF|nr:uncharacterized protein ACA1_307470 [Acanthamoeba castellanii str. Neff]ELR20282.1 hypothetical protein ACA1_307470 [Acanthamoeba castellanii str. Neff]